MSTGDWQAFPYPEQVCDRAPTALHKDWTRLHRGDCEAWPADEAAQAAWQAYHAGRFREATQQGMAAGGAGRHAANKAQMIYANYLEPEAGRKALLLQEVVERCEALQREAPEQANAWYFHAYALGRYSQLISVAEALARGLGGKIRTSLERTLELVPAHAEAHIALGAFQAEVIDKVGALVGGLTYGAKKASAEAHFNEALRLMPDSAIALVEKANGLVLLHGRSKLKEAEQLYARAAECEALDAMERLDVEAARAELED